MAKGAVRLRALEVDLQARIQRGEADEARLLKRVESLRAAEEELRTCRGELGMLREMYTKVTEKDKPKEEDVPEKG